MVLVVQSVCAPSSASRHTLPVFLDQHTVSANRMFMALNPNLNRMLEFWFYLLPPHSFSLSYRHPFIPYSWPWSCFLGIFTLFLLFPIWSVSQYQVSTEDSTQPVSSPLKSYLVLNLLDTCKQRCGLHANMCMLRTTSIHSVQHICAAAERHFRRCLHCFVFNILYVCLCVLACVCLCVLYKITWPWTG